MDSDPPQPRIRTHDGDDGAAGVVHRHSAGLRAVSQPTGPEPEAAGPQDAVEDQCALNEGRCIAVLRPTGSPFTALETHGAAECLVYEIPRQGGCLPLTPPPGRCALVIIDRRLLAETGFAWLGRWRHSNPGLRVLLLWDVGERLNGELTLALLHAQICGVVPPDASAELWGRVLKAVLAGELWFPRTAVQEALALAVSRGASPGLAAGTPHRGAGGKPKPELTPREREILDYLLGGLSNKAIARRLCISPETVKKCLAGLYRKATVNSRGELIARMLS